MATVTHIIRSYYDPADREQLERETGQHTATDDPSFDPWKTESSFSAQRRIRAAPTFVPATVSYDEWGAPVTLHSSTANIGAEPREPDQPSTPATWYRSLTRTAAIKHGAAIAGPSTPPSPSLSISPPLPLPVRPLSAPTSNARSADAGSHRPAPRTKHDWFIHNALRSDPSLSRPSESGSNGSVPSLADLLARDPPPLPGENRYTPPVWLHIGPSNRGFGMLQRYGWREGEGLGVHTVRRGTTAPLSQSVKVEDGLDGAHEVIDLTQSDSEVSEDEDAPEDAVRSELVEIEAAVPGDDASASYMPKSLLTPLPTVLKADRLGIGLKAKTEGPYKRSKKRVTHNAAALALHTKAAEEMRRKKANIGRGRRGFAKAHKREEDGRKKMLAYFNE